MPKYGSFLPYYKGHVDLWKRLGKCRLNRNLTGYLERGEAIFPITE